RRQMVRACIVLVVVAGGALLLVYAVLRDVNAEALRTDLFTTVQIGTAGEVKALLDRGGDPNARETREDEAPGLWERVRQLFARRLQAEGGRSLLELAMRNERHRYSIAKLLIERGVD